MKHGFSKLLVGAALLCSSSFAQAQGLEDIIVEEYHTVTAADVTAHPGGGSYPLVAGMKVYRIYVDMLPNYKLNTVFGSPETFPGSGVSPNKLDFTSSTPFWNDDNFGGETPGQTRRLDEGTLFDSYITINTTGTAGGAVGCGSAAQQFGVLRTADTNGDLTTCGVYPGFTGNDGNIPGTGSALTYNIGGLLNLDAVAGTTGTATTFQVINDAWTTLPASQGVDPAGTNRVLIAQFTTAGAFSFHINVQLSSPTNVLETYVWNQAGAGEVVNSKLTYPQPITGCSSSQSAYLKPIGAGNSTNSILTVGDAIGGYQMVGIPDGLGAFDNGNGTLTLLMNHELGANVGAVRAHGSIGSFVSKWVLDKNTLCVQSGSDLIQNLFLWNGSGFVNSPASPIGRLCSGDLPPVSAFYNAGTGKGTTERIFMSGEEVGNEGRAFGHIATGPNAGSSYQLPYLGRYSWENALACPASGDKTVVIGLDDTTPGQVYVYIGTKTSTGTEIAKAGLNNGKVYGVTIPGLPLEISGSIPAANTPFTLVDLGFVQNTTGALLQTNSVTAGVTQFLRPEDGHFDPSAPNDFYFLTTNNFTSPSRLWKLHFTDILNPELGGTITAVLDGTEAAGQKMMDNMTIDEFGQVWIQEDPGNQAYIARMHKYDIATDVITPVAYHDSARFLVGGANFLTQDEEASGIIDMKDILGKGRFLYVDQAHYATNPTLVEGGQLLEFATGDTLNPCVPASIASLTGATTLCSADTLHLNSSASGTLPISYSWSGTGSFLFGSGSPSALLTGAASGSYTLTVTNACGTDNDAVAVTVNPTTNDTTTISACDTYTWSVNNQVYTTSGTYTNVAGCDTDVLVLTITPSTGGSLMVSACDTYTWTANNQTYTASGTYTNTVACNTDTLVLTITPSTGGSLTASACDSYTWTANNQTYTASGTYTNTVGCNTDTLVLTINPSSGSSLTASACDSYTWTANNQTYTASGTYTNVNACNTDTLVLTITPSSGGSLTASACDSYTWTANNQTYTASGTYTNTVGCNTDTLVLTITPSTGGSLTASACGTYTWTANNQTYTASGTYTNTVGCNTDTLVLTLTIPGTSCDDGNANTINDVYDANCVCAGTPVGGCVNNEVSLTFNTDANAVQTTWNIVSSGTQNAVCSGGGFANNSTITVTCCLPNGCYDLQVFDSMGDGINPGGFVLRDANNNRILDNANNGAAFTSLSKAATSFCLPIGTDVMAAASCDNETLTATSLITATANPAVTAQYNVTNSTSGYQFWIFNPNGGYTRRAFLAHNTGSGPAGPTKCTSLKLSDLVTLPVPQNVLLNVRVRSRVAGVYAEFGPACRMKIAPPPCATTKLIDTPGNPNFSCGVTRTFGGTQFISAFAVAGANKYQFRFERVGGGFVRTIAVNTPNLTLNWNALPLVAGNTYNVTVRISYDGGANYCPYDGSCTVAIVAGPGASAQRSIEVVEEQMVDLQLYPNPNRDGLVFVRMDVLNPEVQLVSVDVTDLFGKRVHAEQIPVSGQLNSSLDLSGLASGVYLVTLTAGTEQWNQRLVIQR